MILLKATLTVALAQMPFSDLWRFPVVIPYARAIGTFSVSI
jgi:hypothetical protein